MNPTNETEFAPASLKPAHPIFSAIATVVSAVIRLFPSIKPPNFAPPGALGLYGGAKAPLWQALLMTISSMVVSDLILRKMFSWSPFNPWVYGCMIGYVLLGRLLLRNTKSGWRIGGVSILGSTIFYIVTNFGSWYGGIESLKPLYAPNVAGLLECYWKALPFFGFTLTGDLGFAFVLFGAHSWVAELSKSRERTPAGEAAK